MEKTVLIDGKPVVFKKTAGTDREYAQKYGREFIVDMMQMHKLADQMSEIDINNTQEMMDFYRSIDQESLYNMLHLMAQKADPTVPDNQACASTCPDTVPRCQAVRYHPYAGLSYR